MVRKRGTGLKRFPFHCEKNSKVFLRGRAQEGFSCPDKIILSKIKFMLINGGDIFMTAKDNTNVIPFIGSGNDWKITKLLEGLRRSTINEETMMKK